MKSLRVLILLLVFFFPSMVKKKAKVDNNVWGEVSDFDYWEFDSPDKIDSGKNMDADFIRRLQIVRDLYGKPIYINSGFRTHSHNQKLVKTHGASTNSSHKKGLAADLRCGDLKDMETLVFVLRQQGFKRIGQYYTEKGNYFVHVDVDDSKPYQSEWAKIKGVKSSLMV